MKSEIIMSHFRIWSSYLQLKFNRPHFYAPQADIRPQTDGCNGLRYNLTADIIESIFRTYPAGKELCYLQLLSA